MEKIDGDNLMLSIVIVALALMVSVVVSTTVSSTNEKVVAMTKEGNSPIEAACALTNNANVCIAAASLRK